MCLYSAAHKQLDSMRVSYVSTRTYTREYLHTQVHELEPAYVYNSQQICKRLYSYLQYVHWLEHWLCVRSCGMLVTRVSLVDVHVCNDTVAREWCCTGEHNCRSQTSKKGSDSTLLVATLWCHRLSAEGQRVEKYIHFSISPSPRIITVKSHEKRYQALPRAEGRAWGRGYIYYVYSLQYNTSRASFGGGGGGGGHLPSLGNFVPPPPPPPLGISTLQN